MPALKKLVRILLVLAALYVVAVLIGCAIYKRALFPSPASPPPIPPGVGQPITAKASDGVTANGLFFPPKDPSAPVVVFFHGNGETVSYDLWRADVFQAMGYGTLLVEYRGYGTAKGNAAPSENGLYADAEAELDAIEQVHGVQPSRIVLWGFSLGTGVASEMAARGHGCALVLEAPFTSILDMADRYTPFFPNKSIVTDRFDTLSNASAIVQPTLVVHGDKDEVVPFQMGQKVARALPHATFIGVHEGHHTNLLDIDGPEISKAAEALISSACRAPGPR